MFSYRKLILNRTYDAKKKEREYEKYDNIKGWHNKRKRKLDIKYVQCLMSLSFG
jgi:hypothetical protein